MSTREPPQSAPRSTFTSRFTRRPLRPLVLIVSGLAALWALFSMIGAFRVFAYENSNSLKHLAPISLALGIVYGVVMGTQLFGFVAAQTQKLGLIQTYSFLSILGGVGIAATGFIEVVVHFVFKNDLINECSNLADGQVVFYGWGLFGPSRSDVLDSSEAQSFCNSAYSRDSVNVVVSALVLSFYGFILATIGRAYFQQVRDPAFGRTQVPAGASAYAMPVYPPAPPQGGFAPPAGPPPGGFAPPAGPPPGAFTPPAGPPPATAYGYGASADASKDPFADQKEVKATPDPKDDPFADFERIPDAERGRP